MIIGFVGKPRTGKTLHITISAYTDLLKGYEIFVLSPLKFNFPSKQLTTNEMLKIPFDIVDRDFKTLCIQEADKVFDARRSMRSENVLLSSLTGQSGKRNLNIYYDTQFLNRVDSGLRYVTDNYIYSSVILDQKNIPIVFKYEVTDSELMPIRKYIIPAEKASQFYSMYDSYEPTEPITKSSTMKEILE